MNTATVRKLHASRIESACFWRDRQYETGAWLRQPFVPFLRGHAVHGARHVAFASYLASKALPSMPELFDAAKHAVEDRVEEDGKKGIYTDPADVTAALDAGLPMVEADRILNLEALAPHVVAVEEELEVPVDGTDFVLTGRLDVRGRDPVTGTGAVLDLKTAEKPPGSKAQLAADLSLQLSNYALLHRVHFGHIPTFALDYVTAMAKGPKAETIARDGLRCAPLSSGGVGVTRRVVTTRGPDDLAAALARLRFRVDLETEGRYPPACSSGLMPECARCIHYSNADPAQRCGFVTTVRTVPNTEGAPE